MAGGQEPGHAMEVEADVVAVRGRDGLSRVGGHPHANVPAVGPVV